MIRYKPVMEALLILLFATAMYAQEPTAVLYDEFGDLNCEDILARADAFGSAMSNNPASVAVILIDPPSMRPEKAQIRRRLISSTLQLRGLEPERLSFYQGEAGEDLRTQFWRVPAGADLPAKATQQWSMPDSDVSRAFIYGYQDELAICPTFVPKAFAKLIMDNPGSRGHIVVTSDKNAMVNKYYFASEWIKTLVEIYGVPRNRLRLFFKKGDEAGAEFWFVPHRRK